jgi:hypothetical protein
MTQAHVIELALDFARMPALARTSVVPPLPANVIELMRIAAASPEACQAAVAKTGEPTPVVVEAARFYLQQTLFRPEADCYRILGIKPTASRELARNHLRWLLQWLHPDRNNNSWDAVYAERVLKAWREVSASQGSAGEPNFPRSPAPSERKSKRKKRGSIQTIRLPWIKLPEESRSLALRTPYRVLIVCAMPTGLLIIFWALWSANLLLRP